MKSDLAKFRLPESVEEILTGSPGCRIARNVEDLVEMAMPTDEAGWYEVAYDAPGAGRVVEARVCRVRNGIAANYLEPYMRRRDPNCMVIADDLPTNKPRFGDRFDFEFDDLRRETFDWLKSQELTAFAFEVGPSAAGMGAVVIAPANAGFFALGLGLLQGILDPEELPESFRPEAVIFVAPPFRHTHFDGKQVVVHRRDPHMHEMFSYNLYPGPSAKKGVYGMLLNLGEQEQWVTAHCSTVQVVTPYDNYVTIMHEGASGGGKSEMLENIHRQPDGRLLIGENVVDGERHYLVLPRACDLRPVTDDMALCHPSLQRDDGKLTLIDAENAWFLRVNHIEHYGTDPHLESITVHPSRPLMFLNVDAAPHSTALIWEHIEDEPGVPCPNPRVIVPRDIVPNVVNWPVSVDIRSLGVRTPPCTREAPTYGIIGLFHLLPPALAWLWRLVAPRGHANPSIVGGDALSSEGVGSYWPFATGRRVDHANLLLEQMATTPRVRYVLIPNQHIGAWKTGFMPQWLAREYLARRGTALFRPEQLEAARCPLLGRAVRNLMIEGETIPDWYLRVHNQPEVGAEGYDAGAEMLTKFFHDQINQYLEPELDQLARDIIQCCLDGGGVEEYEKLIDSDPIFENPWQPANPSVVRGDV